MDQKDNLPKQSSHWEEMLQLGRPSMAHVVAHRKWVKKKEKMIVMSCTWKIRVESKWKSRESSKKKCWENDEKLQKHKSFLLLQEIALQSRYLCLKWKIAIFHHSFTNIENYLIVSPLSLIISFNNPTKDHPYTGGKGEEKSPIEL